MSKYMLINKEGNAVREANDLSKRAELIKLGYRDYNPAPVKVATTPTFSKMKKDELIAYAEEHNIDISSANTKDEIIAILSAE